MNIKVREISREVHAHLAWVFNNNIACVYKLASKMIIMLLLGC